MKFSRNIALLNLKYVNILLVVTLIIQFLFYLSNLEEKGAILLYYYCDLVIVGFLVQCLGRKYSWLIDHGPTIVILARSACVGFLHASYHYGIGLTIGGDIERSQYHGTILIVFLTIGIVCVSNFRCFLLGTTPLLVVGMGVNIYFMIEWPSDTPCDCAVKFSLQSEIAGIFRLLLPIFMGIYFQNKTLVT